MENSTCQLIKINEVFLRNIKIIMFYFLFIFIILLLSF